MAKGKNMTPLKGEWAWGERTQGEHVITGNGPVTNLQNDGSVTIDTQ